MIKTIKIIALSVILALSSNVNAVGFDGAEVTATGYCCSAPEEADRVTVPLTKTVGPEIEFPGGSIQASTGIRLVGSDIDIGNSTISYTFPRSDNLLTGTFNGGVFDFSGPNLPTIIGVSLDPLSTYTASQVGLGFDADTVRINLAGLHVSPGSSVLVDVIFAPVPEPESYAMLLVGLSLLGFVTRHRKNFSK